MSEVHRERIAILGGGVAGMVAAFELSHSGKPYEITLYQMGWRLGGKGASGRNLDPSYHARIEEHGVHMWSGLYENAFRVMRACYAELGRAPDAPLGTWQQAFTPQNTLAMVEEYQGRQIPWVFTVPMNDELPGEPGATLLLPLWDYVAEALGLVRNFIAAARRPTPPALEPATVPSGPRPGPIANVLRRGLLDVLLWLAHTLVRLFPAPFRLLRLLLLCVLRWAMAWLWRRVKPFVDDDAVRQVWILANFTAGNVAGMIAEDVFSRGLDFLDEKDYRAWLGAYVVDDTVDGVPLTLSSPLAFALYDAEFAYVDGDLSRPDFGAGTCLKTLLRMGFTWKGALIWRMRAGMGDTVFAPLYEVLRRRGVKFEFFHRVLGLHLSEDEKRVQRIRVAVQAHPLDPEAGYDPLVTVNGLPCWPSAPLWDQLRDGEALKRSGVDLESYCAPVTEEETLELGRDFDRVVLAIPVGALPYIACELIRARPRWKEMVDHVRTVRTQGAQLWLTPTTFGLGWKRMGWPLLSTFHVSPLNTWADMSDLVDRESWPFPGGRYPLGIAYFCGPMRDEAPLQPGPCGPTQPCRDMDQHVEDRKVRETTRALLSTSIGWIWPAATTPPNDPHAPFDYGLLVDDRPEPGRGEARLTAQFFRANVSPSERFTLTVHGSTRYRIAPGDSGFENLVLAGDWTDNGFNIGNVEATAMSGMLASNAISGHPRRDAIVGLDFGRSPEKEG